MIRTNDTDVLVLAISVAPLLSIDALWVSHGSSKNLQYIPVHTIATSLGREKVHVLPMSHSLTGCDTASFFGGRGKKRAWELTPVLLMGMPGCINDATMKVLERFVILLYDRTSCLTSINQARQELFSKKARSLENTPQLKHPYCNMSREPSTRVVTYGVRLC